MVGETTASEPPPALALRNAWPLAKYYVKETYKRYQRAPLIVKGFVWLFIIINTVIGSAFIFIGPKIIGQKAYNLSQILRNLRFGWLLFVTVIAVTSFPPLIGWSSTITLCGFAYGVPGWFIASAGALLGAAMSFVVLRLAFRERIQAWSRQNKKWQALENVVKARGLPLIILIRLSPFPPWVYANLLFASIETVTFSQFMIATTAYTSRLFVAVWIGSRIAMFSDGEQRDKMDTKGKIVNALSIALGAGIAFTAGWITWKLVEREIRNTPGATEEDEGLAEDALQGAAEDLEAPLINSFSAPRYRDASLDDPSNSDLQRG